ncbi:HNH endonuclease [Nocardioides panacisoli]|uniref:HNH endonuclease signature motif containing protein n=1 Tax=Nocardioides panacisoli TaxID=627624 RepID=UPI001C627B47|nr:HNH endonuclease signature motif containing protein [Nocardioides panacisoli]QYJ03344.1 HNH endonuclease [Nocardioides panacisoli]
MTLTLLPTHPIRGCAAAVRAQVAEVADVEPAYMAAADKAAALEDLARAEAQVAELRLRVLAVSDDVAAEHGARDAGAWLAHRTQAEPRAMRADLALARDLDRSHTLVAESMRSGAVSVAHARVITDAVDALPGHLGPDVVTSAEQTLVGYADQFRPSQLRRLGRRILDVVAPEVADAEDATVLTEQERRARERASLRLRRTGDGTTRITGLLPDQVADRLTTYLEAFTSPRRESAQARLDQQGCDRVPQHRAHAHAFAALLEHLDPAQLPHHGGDATTVMVTLTLDQLRTDLATAGLVDADLDSGPGLTADTARRLACTARIIPVVLGGDSAPLDLGRARRLFTPAQRRALRLRDRRCRAEGCTVPATWCEAHHRRPWADGGSTDLADGVLLCSHHHHRAHDPTYRTDTLPDGDLRFHRRQ